MDETIKNALGHRETQELGQVTSTLHLASIDAIDQRFSTVLMLRPFNTVPHVVVTPNHSIIFVAYILLLL